MTQSITNPQPGDFVQETLVTDTRVFVVVKATAKTLTIAQTKDEVKVWDDPLADQGGYPVVLIAQRVNEGATPRTVRLRKDGTYRVYNGGNPLRPARTMEGQPVRRIDYRA